jgi:hypothetical protein
MRIEVIQFFDYLKRIDLIYFKNLLALIENKQLIGFRIQEQGKLLLMVEVMINSND